MDINPENTCEYKIDGKWKRFRVKSIPIRVKLFGPISWTFYEDAFWSDHGPVIKGEHATYAIRYSGYDDIRMIEQWYRMNKAQNFDEWLVAFKIKAKNQGISEKTKLTIHFMERKMKEYDELKSELEKQNVDNNQI